MPNNSAGGTLGLLSNEDAANSTQIPIVAVEFDTFCNANDNYLDQDCNGNYRKRHVGIDVNSMISKNYTELPPNITNGSTTNAWVTYNSTTHNLSVFLTFADSQRIITFHILLIWHPFCRSGLVLVSPLLQGCCLSYIQYFLGHSIQLWRLKMSLLCQIRLD
jgi:hypothetical protein